MTNGLLLPTMNSIPQICFRSFASHQWLPVVMAIRFMSERREQELRGFSGTTWMQFQVHLFMPNGDRSFCHQIRFTALSLLRMEPSGSARIRVLQDIPGI